MKREMTSLMSELHLYKYFEFRAADVSEIDLHSTCGSLIQKDFLLNDNLHETASPSDKDVNTTGSPPPKRRRKETVSGGKSASKIKITGMNVWCKFLLMYVNEWYPRGLQISLHIRSPGLQDYSEDFYSEV